MPNDQRLDALRIQSAQETLSKMAPPRTLSSLLELMDHLRSQADAVRNVKGPCALCASAAAPTPLPSEMAAIQTFVQDWPDDEKASLLDRCDRYHRDRFAVSTDGRLKVKCPFLVSGECQISCVRPLGSRISEPELGPGSSQDIASEALVSIELGHAVGLRLLGLDHQRVELGAALPYMLAHPEWVDHFLNAEPVLREYSRFKPGRDFVIEQVKQIARRTEPSGNPIREQLIEDASTIQRSEGLTAALKVAGNSTPMEKLWRIRVPGSYRTEDEIEEWRSYVDRLIDETEIDGWDKTASFDALSQATLFGLAYQGRSVRSTLTNFGDRIVEPIVRQALPDLCQPLEKRKASGKLRVGYLSSNLMSSNGALWSRGWIKNHSEDIETFVFSTAPKEDLTNLAYREAADHYYHSPGDVPYTARFIKSLNLDVLIFTDIGITGRNYQYAAMRLAPVQCTAWGHPVTSGLSTVDYYLSSELMEPEGSEVEYREKLIKLPGSGLCMYPRSKERDPLDARRHGLPEGPLLLAPNNIIKLLPKWDYLLAEVSQRLKRPIVFIEFQEYNTRILKQRLKRAGCETVWIPQLPNPEFSKLMDAADLVLDFPAWSGGNTTLDAISYGKPVITLPGEFMRGRHSYAFLKQAKMEALIASNPEHFVNLAADQDLHQKTMQNADLGGPFEDKKPVQALDAWMRSIAAS